MATAQAGVARSHRMVRLDDGVRARLRWCRGRPGIVVTYTTTCSGCYETVDGYPPSGYGYDEKNRCAIGMGCEECGFTGKRRVSHFVPLTASERRQLRVRHATPHIRSLT